MPKHSIYLASSYTNKLYMREIRDKLVEMGHRVTSRWIDEPYDPNIQQHELSREVNSRIATQNTDDIAKSDTVAHFSMEKNDRGGACVEFGTSIGMCIAGYDMNTVLVGNKYHVFDDHPFATYFPTEEGFLAWAEKEAKR